MTHLTPELALSLRGPADAQISPDGEYVAYTVGDLAASGSRHTLNQLFIASIQGGELHAISPAGGNVVDPRWSPDGSSVTYLLASADGDHELFIADPWSAPGRKLECPPGVLSAPAWLSDGQRIAVLSDEEEAAGSRHASPDWLPAERRARIWIVDTQAAPAFPASPDTIHVWEFCVSPADDRIAAVISDGPGEGQWFECRLAIIEAEASVDIVNGSMRGPGDSNPRSIYRQVAAPVWSPDGRHLAFVMGARSDRDIVGGDLCIIDIRTRTLSNLTQGRPLTVTSLVWPRGGALTFAAYASGQQSVGRVSADGQTLSTLWRDRATFDRFWPRISLSTSGDQLVTTREDPVTPREVWTAEVQKDALDWRPLTHLNDEAKSWSHPIFHDVEWDAKDGTRLSGILAVPPNAAQRPAMVTWIHGGPTFLHKHLFYAAASPWILGALPELIAAQGIAVFLPNPRGSMGWGAEFAEKVIGDMGGADGTDILAGVDHCIEHFGIDESKLGVGGWSYGGFMSAWLVTQTRRFAAAMVGAGTVNWRSQHGTSVIGEWDRQYLRDDPYRVGGEFDLRAPLTYVTSVSTPTMLAHGTRDSIVPPGQALEFANGLRSVGCPVQLSFYEDEGHDFAFQETQIKLGEDIAGWFRDWLVD